MEVSDEPQLVVDFGFQIFVADHLDRVQAYLATN
jgi:hypothetical protein